MEKENKFIKITFSAPCFMPEIDVNPAVSRGQVLSGVLDGLAGYDSVPVLSDCPAGDFDSEIDYDPANDQRLDRFDAVEMGIEALDAATSAPSQPQAEKKE